MAARLFPLALLLISCGGADPAAFILYKAAPETVEGRLWAGSLVVTSAGRALSIERNAHGDLRLSVGELGSDGWTELRRLLADVSGLRPDEVASGGDVFQIYAQFGTRKVKLSRDTNEVLEAGTVALRDRLDEIRKGLTVPADPVSSLELFLQSPSRHVRGQAVNALALLSRRGEPEVRARADRRLKEHLLTEKDRGIVEEIQRVRKKGS